MVVLGKAESSSKKVRTLATERGEVSEQRAEEQEGGKKEGGSSSCLLWAWQAKLALRQSEGDART